MNMRYNALGAEAINALGWQILETLRTKSKAKQMYKVYTVWYQRFASSPFRMQICLILIN